MPGHEPLDRRSLLRRAAVAGAGAWTAPVIIGSLASPAGALTNTCYFHVIRLRRSGGSANASAAIVNTASCATTRSGLTATCSTFTRTLTNGGAPVGTVTLAASYNAALTQFALSVTESSAACSIVGAATTNGVAANMACATSITFSPASGNPLNLNVTASNINNVQAWAYIAYDCT